MIIAAFMSISLTGCLKDDPNVDFSKLSTVVEMPYSGKAFFSSDALNFTSDTITLAFTVNIASAYPLSKDLSVTVGIDESLVTDYNAYDPLVHYEVMPAAAYSFSESTFTIPAGKRLDTLYVTFYKPGLPDPTVSYMLPITIKDASGETISGNLGTHYYHAIGNPIAGTYSQEWIRWNATDTTGTPTFDEDYSPAVFSPVDPTTIAVQSGTGVFYYLSFTNTDGVLSDFNAEFDPGDVAAVGITITSGPKVLVADPINGIYRLYFTYNNSAGDPRCIIDQFVKQ